MREMKQSRMSGIRMRRDWSEAGAVTSELPGNEASTRELDTANFSQEREEFRDECPHSGAGRLGAGRVSSLSS
jgi:hypothetical protein